MTKCVGTTFSYSPKDIFSEYLRRQLHLLNALDNNYSTWNRWGEDTHLAAELSRGIVAWLAGLFLWIIIHQLLLWQPDKWPTNSAVFADIQLFCVSNTAVLRCALPRMYGFLESYQDPNGPKINPEIQKNHLASILISWYAKQTGKLASRGKKKRKWWKLFLCLKFFRSSETFAEAPKSLLFGLRSQNSQNFADILAKTSIERGILMLKGKSRHQHPNELVGSNSKFIASGNSL